MLILYKNARNVRFVLFTKTSNGSDIGRFPNRNWVLAMYICPVACAGCSISVEFLNARFKVFPTKYTSKYYIYPSRR